MSLCRNIKKKIFILFVFLFRLVVSSSCFAKPIEFEQVVIWGHKLGSHTHSYVHYGFFRAFAYLEHPTYWFDDSDDVDNFDFSKTLFITEGQVDKKIPLRNDCFYVLHNIRDFAKYQKNIDPKKYIFIQVYTDDVLNNRNVTKIEPFVYYGPQKLFMPWATDLLPYEIDLVKEKLSQITPGNCVHWVGTIGDGLFGNRQQLAPFIQASDENGIDFMYHTNVSPEENQRLILESYMAPTIIGKWQYEKGYIPCRIFKNISYGKMGVTNSRNAYELFDKKIVYNPDTYQLFYDAEEKIKTATLEDMFELMDMVKSKHTYLNRIQTILDFFKNVSD